MGTNVTGIWDPMGHARFCGEFGVLLEFLDGEVFFGHLEYGSWLFGWKEISALLRLKRNRLFNYKLYTRVLCLIGLGAGAL